MPDDIAIDYYDPGIDPDDTPLDAAGDEQSRLEELAAEKDTTPERIAAWAMRRLAATVVAAEKARELYLQEKATLDDYLERATTTARQGAGFFDALLTQHMEVVHRRDGIKTVPLPNGSLTARKNPDKVEVRDGDDSLMLLLKWCQTRGRMGWMKVEFTPKIHDLKKALQPAGPVIELCGPVCYELETGLLVDGVLWDEGAAQAVEWETGLVIDRSNGSHVRPVPQDGLLEVTDGDGVWLVPGIRHTVGPVLAKATPAKT